MLRSDGHVEGSVSRLINSAEVSTPIPCERIVRMISAFWLVVPGLDCGTSKHRSLVLLPDRDVLPAAGAINLRPVCEGIAEVDLSSAKAATCLVEKVRVRVYPAL
jgi:hypothetical protein